MPLELLAAYRDGDVHLECARRCNMVPHDATSAHPMRRVFKICNLAVVYRAGLPRIASQLGMPVGEAHRFL
jgi:DNA polymerase I-like protein with 3'-5' exonuclease and polymerase domains